jgi:DNA-binding IclR family transcriptional regulator
MKTEKINGFQVPNLERGLQILEFMTECDDEISVSQLSKKFDFPMNSVSRIMNALDHYGYVFRNPETKGYLLSNKMMTICAGRASQKNLMEQSLDIMRQVRDETGETVVISVLHRDEGLILEQVQGLHPFRFVCEPGTRQALHASASTKAILACMDEQECASILKRIKFKALTDSTITSPESFQEELVEVAQKGYALDRAEALEGVHCAAAPILDSTGHPVAAVTVTGPAHRMHADELDQIGSKLREYTQKISVRMGFKSCSELHFDPCVTPRHTV